jgi:ethylbenzene dioxygenase beta subunit
MLLADGPIETSTPAASDEREVNRFVYREARLIDERRFDEWLELWDTECRYFIPANDYADSPLRVSVVRDNRHRLEERVFRLTHADAHAQEPFSRTTHQLSNVESEWAGEDLIEVNCVSTLFEVRNDYQEIYSGRTQYLLRLSEGRFHIQSKTVNLTRNNQLLGNLTFLI